MSKALEVLPPIIVAYLEEQGGAWSIVELIEHIGYTQSCVLGVLLFMEGVGTVERRRLRSDFFFLKGKYDDGEIEKIVEEGLFRRYKIRRVRRGG